MKLRRRGEEDEERVKAGEMGRRRGEEMRKRRDGVKEKERNVGEVAKENYEIRRFERLN